MIIKILDLLFSSISLAKRGHAFIHPHNGLFLNFALMLSFGKFITTKGNKKVAIGIIMFLMLTAHLTTLGKCPLLALIMGIVFVFYFIRPIRKVFISISLLIIIIIASFIVGNIVELENSLALHHPPNDRLR